MKREGKNKGGKQVFCPACGQKADAVLDRCASCGEPLIGKSYGEQVLVSYVLSGSLNAPDRCCCCLNPKEVLAPHAVRGSAGRAVMNVDVKLPWCAECHENHSRSGNVGCVGMALALAGAIGLMFIEARFSRPVPFWMVAVDIAAAFAFYGILMELFTVIGLVGKKPGHVRGCGAVGPGGILMAAGGGNADFFTKLVFHNKAFAGLFRIENNID